MRMKIQMLILEILLIASIIYLGIKASISDYKDSIIPNQLLHRVLPIILALNMAYYILFARPFLEYALINLLFVTIFSFFLYNFNLWAAGDSKLLFVMTLGIPARYYTYWILGPFPGFLLLVIIFSIAFIYVIVDSIRQGIKRGDLLKFDSVRFDMKTMLWSYFLMVGIMTVCNLIMIPVVGGVFRNAGLLITAIDFMIILVIREFRENMNERARKKTTVIIWVILIVMQVLQIIPKMHFGIDIKSWSIVFIVMFLRFIAEKYNYQEIIIDELKPRMIPSAYTIMKFRTSRVKGLPTGITEDLRSRLTAEDISAIKRWQNSKQGMDTITIVRKIPFAIFIFLGTVFFLFLEVMLLWRT